MLWKLLFIAVCAWSMYYRWKRRRLHKIYNELPTPGIKAYPFIGHAYLFGRNSEDRMNFFKILGYKANEQGGLTSVWIANKLFINVCDPVTAGFILKRCLDKDDTIMRIFRTLSGNGSAFAPVNIWRPRRKIIASVFRFKNMQGFVQEFAKQASIMTELLEQQIGKSEVSMWSYYNTYSFDGIFKNSLDIDFNSQTNRTHPYLEAFEKVSTLLGLRVVSPWLYWDPVYKLFPAWQELKYWRGVTYDLIDNLVRLKRKELAALKSRNEFVQSKTILDMLIKYSGKEMDFTNVEIREEITVLIAAASDTTAISIGFTAVMLSRYPEVQDKVYQELEEVIGNTDRPVTAADLPKCIYLEAVVKETLRLYPPVPVFVREILNDCELPNGTTLVNGVGVGFNVYGIHRNPKYWGDDAEKFRPERFLEGPLRHPVQFIPFGYSVRNCIGGTYAMMSIKTALATMLRRYRLLPPASLDPQQIKEPLRVTFNIMMKHVGDFSLKLENRK